MKPSLLVGRVGAAGGFFGRLPMYREFWAEDPGWSNPGDGNVVVTMRDNGTAANNAGKTGVVDPVYRSSTINGRPGIDFQATAESIGGRLAASSGTSGAVYSVVAVAEFDRLFSAASYVTDSSSGTGNRAIIGGLVSGSKWRAYHSATAFVEPSGYNTDPHLFVAVFKTDDIRLYVDGSLVGTDNSGTVIGVPGLSIGGDRTGSNQFLDGRVCYVAQYNGDITTHAEYAAYHAAIMSHYAI